MQVSRKEMQATLALRFGGEGILKVKGIPFKACAADVRKFFSGYKIKVGGVSFIMHADGRPTGMAFIEFATPQEAVRAMVSECWWSCCGSLRTNCAVDWGSSHFSEWRWLPHLPLACCVDSGLG
jgi:hypothetical protein